MKRSIQQVLVPLLIAAVMVAACGAQPTRTPPVGKTPPGGVIRGEAVVETIDILILESFPVQVNVVARGNLPDGCTEIDEIGQERSGKAFEVTIPTARPADAACTQALEPFEKTISLDVHGLPAGSYGVDVNGATGAFELAVDNVMPTESPTHQGPPPAILEIDGREQVSGIGNYCWPQGTGEQSEVIVCADAFAVITPEEPLVVSSPSTANFRLAMEEEPDRLFLQIALVTPEDELRTVGEGWHAWPGGQGESRVLGLLRESQTELDLAPGLYVLDLQAGWDEWGDVSYGFLVEVQSPPPSLTVDESPIVAVGIDGPGHFEYADRLGDDIVTRMEGLRAYADEQKLSRANAALAPFGYRLEARFDAEWNQTVL